MAKDINIKVKTEGVDQVKQDLDQLNEEMSLFSLNVDKEAQATAQAAQDTKDFQEYLAATADSAKDAGDAVEEGGKKAGEGMDKASQKASILDRIINGIQNSAFRMITGFLGLSAVVKLVTELNARLDEMLEKQKKLTEKTLTGAEGGQAIEAATGTVGKQDYWTWKITELQKAGGLGSADQASALMLGMQEATAGIGGIQNPAVAAMLKRLAPRIGASGKSASDLSAIFEAATKESVGPEVLESFISGKLGVSDQQAGAYMQSYLGRSRSASAAAELKSQLAQPGFRDWQQYLKDAEAELEIRTAQGQNKFWVRDKNEVLSIAQDKLLEDLKRKRDSATGLERDRLQEQIQTIGGFQGAPEDLLNQLPIPKTLYHRAGMEAARTFNITYDYSTHRTPTIAPDPFQMRADPNNL